MSLLDELLQIPAALDALAGYYAAEGKARLRLPFPKRVLLTGMGASFHAASIGALMFQQAGVDAQSVESVDLLGAGPRGLEAFDPIFYISQSGGSGEIQPFLDMLPDTRLLVALTNDSQSPLARGAGRVLPMVAGEESWIAGKTYINPLGILWLLAQSWGGRDLSAALEEVRALAEQARRLQADGQEAVERLDELLSARERLIFLGGGPHSLSAREAAMTLSEWPKISSQWYGLGAFRHGFIETVDAESGVVLFSPQGATRASALALGQELASYGAKVLRIENGAVRGLEEPGLPAACAHELLSPILDILPVQLYAEAAARRRYAQPGFRYIGKVVTRL
jgi:glucosamine--fructose-6-phosphate aminotransferase (isomerizing)